MPFYALLLAGSFPQPTSTVRTLTAVFLVLPFLPRCCFAAHSRSKSLQACLASRRFHSLSDWTGNYLMIPKAFFGNRPTSSCAMPKLSAISDAGFPASHFEMEISSKTGLLKSAKSFVGSLPICST